MVDLPGTMEKPTFVTPVKRPESSFYVPFLASHIYVEQNEQLGCMIKAAAVTVSFICQVDAMINSLLFDSEIPEVQMYESPLTFRYVLLMLLDDATVCKARQTESSVRLFRKQDLTCFRLCIPER